MDPTNPPLDDEQEGEEQEEEQNQVHNDDDQEQESSLQLENEEEDAEEEGLDGGGMLEGGGNNQDEGFEGEDPEQQEVEDGEEERLLNNDLDDEEENAEGGVEEADEGQGNLNLTENGEEGEEEGQVPPPDMEEIANMQLLLPDSDTLYDASVGFEVETNIKTPMLGFSSSYQDYFFPLIDAQSGVLFEIVQEVERAVYKSNEDLLRGVKEPLAIPTSRLILKVGGPEIRFRMLDPSEPLISVESSEIAAGMSSSSTAISPPATTAHPSPGGWQKTTKGPESLQMEKQITPAEKAFSPDKLAKLKVPFGHGWKREIVIRSHGGGASKKLGDVYYFSPQGVKYRSSKQVALFLNKHPALNMSVENFSFAKARVSYDLEEESVRAAQGGRNLNPVKNMLQKQIGGSARNSRGHSSLEDENESNGIGESSESGLTESPEGESVVKGRAGGRRSIQPPKRYATAEFIPEPSKRAKMSAKSLEKESESYSSSRGGGMEMGMLHPKYRGSEEEKSGEQMLQEFRARRGRPPGKLPGSPMTPNQQYQQQQQLQNQRIHHQQQGRGMGSRPSQQQHHHQREDGPMFGISALTQGAAFSNFTDGLEYGSSADSSEGGYDGDTSLGDMEVDGRRTSGDKVELLPCSIRCPGMTGEIPTLQCKRCLCLYHPGCLGLPNQPYRNFYCSNCEGDDGGSGKGSVTGGSPLQKSTSRNNVVLMKGGIRLLKRSEPPPLIHLNSTAPGGGGGMSKFSNQGGMRRILPKIPNLGGGGGGRMGGGQSFQRLAPPSLIRPGMQMGGVGVRRGRGRPPRMALNSGHPGSGNNLSRGSLTITPISNLLSSSSRGRGGLNHGPQIPRLQPMSGSFMRGGLRKPGGMMHPQGQTQKQFAQLQQQQSGAGPPRGQMMRGRGVGRPVGGQYNHHPPQMQLLQRGGLAPTPRLRGPGFRLSSGGLKESGIFRLDPEGRVLPRGVGGGGTMGPGSPPQFQRYAQSVVTINQKKYLALPKNSSGVAGGAGFRVGSTGSGVGGRASLSQPIINSSSTTNPPTNPRPRTAEDKQVVPPPPIEMVSNSLGVEQEEGGEDTSEETQSLEGMSQEDTLELEEEEEANQTQTTIEGEEEEPMETSLDDCEDKEMEEEEEESLPDVNFGGLELERRSKKAILGRILSNLSHPDKLRFRRVAKLWKCAIDEPQMWRKLSLRGVRVRDWRGLQEFILRHQVVELDTRGAVIGDMEEFWQQLLALEYSCSTSSLGGVRSGLGRVVVCPEVAQWSEGSLLKEFQDTGKTDIVVI